MDLNSVLVEMVEDLDHMGSCCHICLLEDPSSGSAHTHLSVALVIDLNSVVV